MPEDTLALLLVFMFLIKFSEGMTEDFFVVVFNGAILSETRHMATNIKTIESDNSNSNLDTLKFEYMIT